MDSEEYTQKGIGSQVLIWSSHLAAYSMTHCWQNLPRDHLGLQIWWDPR